LEAVIRAGSGYDTIDVKTASSKGIYVANCPGKNATAVAELVFGFVLGIDRRIPENVMQIKNAEWNKGEFSKSRGVKGRTIGIIGYGSIGKDVAHKALAFGMDVICISRRTPQPDDARIVVASSMDELLSKSDIVTLHCPAKEGTKGMVNKDFLNKMKKDAILINTSRGAVINEADLLAHLDANKDFWVGTDVYMGEPADKKATFDSVYAKHPRVYGTHHIGASTK